MKVRANTRLAEAGRIYVVGEVFETSPERAKALGNSVLILEEPKPEEPKKEETKKEEPEKKEIKEAPEDKMVKKAKSKKV